MKLLYTFLLAAGLQLALLTGSSAQDCTGCTAAPMSGTMDFNNTVVCVPDGSTFSPQNINGTANVICIPAGSTWEYTGTNLNVNGKTLTIVVSGTLSITNTSEVTIGAAIVNVQAGGSIVSTGSKLKFHNTEVNNAGQITVNELETAETNYFTNQAGGKLTVNGKWYQHGGLVNQGEIETLCGVVDPSTPGYPNLPACEFLIGDKGTLFFENTGTIKITGPTTVGGEVRNTCGGQLIVDGNIQINKLVVGGGTLVASTGSVSGDGGVRPSASDPSCRPTVYIRETPNNDFNTNTPSNPGNNDYDIPSQNPLPVKLTHIYVRAEGTGATVEWATSEEVNSGRFIVERSSDMRNWTQVGGIDASGNTYSVVNYAFTDENVGQGIWYYRLKIVDIDGSYEYSSARSVFLNVAAGTVGVVYPNPTQGTLFVKDAEQVERVYIYDKSGKVMKSVQSFNFNGIDVSDLPAGTYLVRLIYQNGSMQVHNVVINK